jgi:D-alanine-D-alanine ligase-like ATP-grasp enzyme
MIKDEKFKSFSTYLIAVEAERRGIKVKRVLDESEEFKESCYLILTYKKHQEVVISQMISKTSETAHMILKNKHLTKIFLNNNNIKVAKGSVFNVNKLDGIKKFFKKIKFPVVVKPLSATHGECVYMGIKSHKEILKTIKELKANNFDKIIIEEEFKGDEYRIFATENKFLAAINRIPANVVGDGISNIKKLIEIKNSDPRRGGGHSKTLVKIEVDSIVKDFLKKQKLTLKSVPRKSKQVFLRPNSNLSTGGDSIDVTDLVHPDIKKLSVKAIKSIPGLKYGGIDFLTKDITKKPTKNNYIIIEINASPMLSMHHIPYKGKSRNVAGEIVNIMFPETKNKK